MISKVLKIEEPFWGAWSIYKWPQRSPGIGVNMETVMDHLKNKTDLFLYVGRDPELYRISPITIKNWVNTYKSVKKVRNNTLVCVFPMNKLQKVISS